MAGFLHSALLAWKQATGGAAASITNFEIGEALQIAEPIAVQTVVENGQFDIYSLVQRTWRRHAGGRVQAIAAALDRVTPLETTSALDAAGYYRTMREAGLEYGPEYRTIRDLQAGLGFAAATVQVDSETAAAETPITPALLDGCLQTVLAAKGDAAALYLPSGIERFDLYREPGPAVRCQMVTRPAVGGDTLLADFDLSDETGALVASGRGLRLKRVRAMQSAYEMHWTASARQSSVSNRSGSWLVVAQQDHLSDTVLEELKSRGVACTRRAKAEECRELQLGSYAGILCLTAESTREDCN
jgi:hypothetical protein